MSKLIFSGSQGTGKSTVLNLFKERMNYPVITEVVRQLAKTKGIKINKQGSVASQNMIWNEYKRLLSQRDSYISDRGLTDVISYTEANSTTHPELEGLLEDQWLDLVKFTEAHPDILYVYFPIEFPVVADGVRSTDEDYRAIVDDIIRGNLNRLGIDYLEVHGTPEERYQQIIDWVGSDNF